MTPTLRHVWAFVTAHPGIDRDGVIAGCPAIERRAVRAALLTLEYAYAYISECDGRFVAVLPLYSARAVTVWRVD